MRTQPVVNAASVEALGRILAREPYDPSQFETETARDERRREILIATMRDLLEHQAMSHRRVKLLAYHVLGLYEQGYVTATDFTHE